MRTIQPYFVIATSTYHKEVMMKHGISHFYRFCRDTKDIPEVLAVPDGCVDILFEKDEQGVRGRAAGTMLKNEHIENIPGREYFGVRFQPGVCPAILDTSLADLTNAELNLEDVLYDKDMLKEIEETKEEDAWIDIFLRHYEKALQMQEERRGREDGTNNAIVHFVQDAMIHSNGTASIAKLAQDTGYSERYVHKLFSQEMGISPKAFGKIMQFQKAIQLINQENDQTKLTDIGMESGYYDQAHFIREFKKYAQLTPGKYSHLIQTCHYSSRIIETTVHE